MAAQRFPLEAQLLNYQGIFCKSYADLSKICFPENAVVLNMSSAHFKVLPSKVYAR